MASCASGVLKRLVALAMRSIIGRLVRRTIQSGHPLTGETCAFAAVTVIPSRSEPSESGRVPQFPGTPGPVALAARSPGRLGPR